MKRLNDFRIPVAVLVLLLPLFAATPAFADAPVQDVISSDIFITFPGSQNACGFDVTVHIWGQIKVSTWYDEAGNPTRAKEGYGQSHFTWEAGYGHTLTSLVQGPIHFSYLSATERIMHINGTNALMVVPGYGPALGNAGRLTVKQGLDPSGFWVDVEVSQSVGVFAGSEEDVAAACAYLGP